MNPRPKVTSSGRRRFPRALLIGSVVIALVGGASSAHADVTPWPTVIDGANVKMLNAVGDVPTTRYRLGSRVLRIGMRGTDVRGLQRLLQRRGFRLAVDGDFGPVTRKRVRRYQRRVGLFVDGVVGRRTFAKLGVTMTRPPAAPVPAIVPTDYPLAGPNAANAKHLKAFPVAGPHWYFNDFGAPRPQGTHEGNDIMADAGIPVRAVANGTVWKVNRVESGLGGIYLWFEDANGTDYYYAHLTSIAKDIVVGSAVTAGQVIGAVGNTGDARGGAPHLHFEIRPQGVGPINPYRDLLAVDPEPPTGN